MLPTDGSNGIRRSDFLRGIAASVAAAGLASVAPPAAAEDAPPLLPLSAEPKPPTPHTLEVNALYRKGLPFDDKQDFEDARRGLVAALPEPVVIRNGEGDPIYDLSPFAFVRSGDADEAPDTVNPSLWRMAKLNMIHGLFEVADGIWQARGYDLSNMTIMRSASGYIVIDPLISSECASTIWRELVVPKLGDKPIVAVIYTHSHIDHFGGIRGIVSQADVDAGKVRILAPAQFMDAVTGEFVLAGNAMGRRATYMYGILLPKSPVADVDNGLGKATSTGSSGLIRPTDVAARTGEVITLDGIDIHVLMAPESEAPSEFMFYLPKFRAFCAAEDATHTLHNLYTLRGAKVRDGLLWSKYLQQALDMFGPDIDVVFASHHWPTWGHDRCVAYLKSQRDTYRFLHDQVMRMANSGMTPKEIGEAIRLPDSLAKQWACRSYYGSVYHDAVAQYNLRLGFFDGVPANLHPLPPVEAGRRFVEYMGGADAVLSKAKESLDQGDYRWVAEVVNHVVFADGSNESARLLLADAYEQLGYQAESAPWRDIYLTGAQELRHGIVKKRVATSDADIVLAMPLDLVFDAIGVGLNAGRAAGKKVDFNFDLTDTNEKYVLGVENGAIHYSKDRQLESPDASLTTTRADLLGVFLGQTTLEKLIVEGKAKLRGDPNTLAGFVSWIDTPDFWFNIVTA